MHYPRDQNPRQGLIFFCLGIHRPGCTFKKEKKIFLIYQEIQKGSGEKPYMRKGFLIYEEIRKYLVIYEEAVSHTSRTLHSIPSKVPYLWGKCSFLFLTVWNAREYRPHQTKILSVPSNAHISTPFFQKTVFFSKICFGSPLKIFGGMSKFGIYVKMKSSLQF